MIKGAKIRMRRRSLLMAILMSGACFVYLIYRLVILQIVQGSFLESMAVDQQLTDTKISAQRGAIYDRDMNLLAQSASVWNVALEPNSIKKDDIREKICQNLYEITGVDKQKIFELSKKRTFCSIIKKKVDANVRNKIIEFKNKHGITAGIRLIEDYKRYYPLGRFASAVLGFTGVDGQGLAGLEAYYDKYLRGEQGRIVNSRNAIGTEMPYDYEQMINPKAGNNLRLTIDSRIQRIVDKYLLEAVISNKVQNRGVAIAMDVTNGEILAMSVKEDFDPNEPFKIVNETEEMYLNSLPESEQNAVRGEILSKQWRNKAVSDTYYPGSVFKMVVASMGMDLGLVDDNAIFTCSGGIKISERSQYIRCHRRRGHGAQNFAKCFCSSCNPAFISLGQKIGTENFFNYYKSFGFHERTGIDLPGEATDLFFSQSGKMALIDLAVASIGQNFGITPIQMITAAAAIANGGKLVRPHIVKEILNSDGEIVKSFDTNTKRTVISSEVAKKITNLMEENANTGGAKNAHVAGFRVAGKTGTSEKIGLSTPGHKDYISSFCGFAPADNPKIALLTFLDTPRGDYYYGGIIAAPIFANIMNEVLPLMGIPEEYSPEEIKKYGTTAPDFLAKKQSTAKELAIISGFTPIILGKGELVTSQMPIPGERIPQGGTIILYTEILDAETIKVPDFYGLNIKEAKELALKNKLNIKISGCKDDTENLVEIQSPKINTIVPIGSVVEIKFISKEHNENI
ncbi:MAG: stage V sporulation protein D [Candidatus Improbicoccus devescovinae]|nr:MAG: stage V sporulation protein D [Candidatus Improbicoccus devescovinae]